MQKHERDRHASETVEQREERLCLWRERDRTSETADERQETIGETSCRAYR